MLIEKFLTGRTSDKLLLAMTDCQSYGMMSCMASLSSSNTNRVLFFDVTGFNMAFSYRVMTSFTSSCSINRPTSLTSCTMRPIVSLSINGS